MALQLRPQQVRLSAVVATVQVEVYDPSPGSAQKLVSSGQILPVR